MRIKTAKILFETIKSTAGSGETYILTLLKFNHGISLKLTSSTNQFSQLFLASYNGQEAFWIRSEKNLPVIDILLLE